MRLKEIKRTGWLDRGIDPGRAESVADHTLGVALLAWATALERHADGAPIDPDRLLKLVLLHDLAEAETGDAPPYDPDALPDPGDAEARRQYLDRRHVRDETRESEKRAAEDDAMAQLLERLPDAARAEIEGFWLELRDGTSAEARFVKQVDRLETFLQSRHYRQSIPELPVESIRREVAETIDDPLLAAIRDAELRKDDANSE
jgi:putative hydrolase of HD superfamily